LLTAKIHTVRQFVKPGALPFTVHLPFFIALTFLMSCSQIFSTTDDVPTSRIEADYRKLIATQFTSSFADYNSFSTVEISSPRPVDSMVGRTTITCVRFDAVLRAPVPPGSTPDAAASNAQKRRLAYVYFIRNNAIVDARYDVQTDQCATQSYEPFNLALYLGKTGPAQNPIY
jgi:hypothetical protein